MPLITRWQDFETHYPDGLTPAEELLVAACKAGEECTLEDGALPPEGPPSPTREIRADLLRYLILGGCDACLVNGWGVQLYGAHVTGELDLSFASAKGITDLMFCRFEQEIIALQTHFDFLDMSHSILPGLDAQGAKVTGHVFLRGITAKATVALLGATIGGQLDCTGAKLLATEGHALNAQGAQVTETVFLRGITAKATVTLSGATIGGQLDCEGAKFAATKGDALDAQGAQVTDAVFLRGITAKASVTLSGATIGGQLDCEGAEFAATDGDALNAQHAQVTETVFLRGITAKATVTLSGATIGGQLACTGAKLLATEGHALNAQRLRVTEGLFWHDVTVPTGMVDLNSAHVGDLMDDPDSWPPKGRLFLDGFTYDQIGAFTDARRRTTWLEQGSEWEGEFFPQPFTHLAKVLREMGHDRDARAVLFRRELLIRRNIRARARITPNGDVSVGLLSLWVDVVNIWRWI